MSPSEGTVDVGEGMHGWQYHTSNAREQYVLQKNSLPAADASRRAMLLSESGPSAGRWLTAMPTTAGTTLERIRMQVALRRRLRWPLPAGSGRCVGRSCQSQLDVPRDHMVSHPLSGRLSMRAKP